MTFGTMCRMMIRVLENPFARAASIYGISRIAKRTEDRTTRAHLGMKGS